MYVQEFSVKISNSTFYIDGSYSHSLFVPWNRIINIGYEVKSYRNASFPVKNVVLLFLNLNAV